MTNARKYGFALTALSVLFLGTAAVSPTVADDYPNKSLQLIVAANPGGASDTIARQWSQFLPKHLGVPVVVENIPGLNAIKGTRTFLNRDHDCYTLLQMAEPFIVVGMLRGELDIKIDDLAVINREQFDRVTFTVRKDSAFGDFVDLVNYAKANPDKLTVAFQPGAAAEVILQIMKNDMGLQFRMVPYASGSDLRTALLGGVVDAYSSVVGGDRHVADQVRLLGIVGDTPAPAPFDAQPFNEQLAAAGYNVTFPAIGSQRVLMTHRGCQTNYPERFEKLVNAYKEMLDSAEYQAFITERDVAWITEWLGPTRSDEVRKDMLDTYARYKDILIK